MVAFVAQQIGVNPGALADYARRDTNRRAHAVEAQRHLGLHPAGREDRRGALLAAIELLRQLNRDDRRGLPAKMPIGHLTQKVRKLIAADGKRDRRLWELATFAVLRGRSWSGEVWVEGGRALHLLETQLMANPTFAARKAAGDLRLGVPHGADAWIAEKQRELDFKLKKLSYQARAGKLVGVRFVNGVLTIAKERTKVPKAKVEAKRWIKVVDTFRCRFVTT